MNPCLGALLGDPVKHSLSPLIFQFLRDRGILETTFTYLPLRLPPENLAAGLSLLRQLPLRGLNITLPHKEKILSLLDEVTGEARHMGAVNVVRFDWGGAKEGPVPSWPHNASLAGPRLIGHNTDAEGLQETLREYGIEVQGRCAFLLGAGGAARAAGFILGKMKAKKVYVTNRGFPRAQNLGRDLKRLFPGSDFEVKVLPISGHPITIPPEVSLVINATSMGMEGGPAFGYSLGFPPEKGHALDLVYRPLETPFLKMAMDQGFDTVDGLSMLIWQALGTLNLFFPDWKRDFSESGADLLTLKRDLHQFLQQHSSPSASPSKN